MPESSAAPTQKPRYFHPKFWPTWLAIALLTLWSMLPWALQWQVAKLLAFASYHLAKRRRKIVEVNLKLCFPEWSEKEHRFKVKETLFNNILGLVESTNAFRKPIEKWAYGTEIKGQEVLAQAAAQGRGVLLLGAHYTQLDLGSAIMRQVGELHVIYRPNSNPLFDDYIQKGRHKLLQGVHDRKDMRAIIRVLKRNEVIWYPPDQDYGRQHSVFAPFFGVPAATITATSRLVKFNQSPVVMTFYYRDDKERCYKMEFLPAPEDFPSGDDVTDATLINQALEKCIRRAPTQYMWTHRRFKTRPEGGKKGQLYK